MRQIFTIVGIFGVAMGAMALDNVEVTDVKARQRYPWNGKVDIDFTLDSKPTEPYQMQVEVYDNVGKTNLPVKSVCTEGVSVEANPCMVRTDTRRIVWDAAKDLPNGFKCTNVLVTCRDARAMGVSNLYMVVDLSGGRSAKNFSVSYTNAPPCGGWTEEYMTDKLVLRRVEPDVFMMGSKTDDFDRQDNEVYHKVILSKVYYIGVFEITDQQFVKIYGGTADGDVRPATKTWDVIRGFETAIDDEVANKPGVYFKVTQKKKASSYCWPESENVDPKSFVGILRTKTGFNFDLPMEAQWEYACRAGAIAPLYLGVQNSVEARKLISGSCRPSLAGTHDVYTGNCVPNSLGLYEISGNVGEWCLDVYVKDLSAKEFGDEKDVSVIYTTQTLLSQNHLWVSGAPTYNGVTYAGMEGYCDVEFIAQGICHVVRGCDQRSSSRSSALNFNVTEPIFTTGISWRGRNVKAQYSNPAYGIRLALTIDENNNGVH